MTDCLSNRSSFGPIGTGKEGPAFEATAGHFGFSMPSYSAEQLARAAEAGEPKANSEFADGSEWQAYQTECLYAVCRAPFPCLVVLCVCAGA